MKIIVDQAEAITHPSGDVIVNLSKFPNGLSRTIMGRIVKSLRSSGYEVIERDALKIRMCKRCKVRPIQTPRGLYCPICTPIVNHENRRNHDACCDHSA